MTVTISIAMSYDGYSQKTSKEKLPRGAVKLEYNFPENVPVSFLSSSKVSQTMDVNGQNIEANVDADFGCTVKATGKQDRNLKMEIRIDTMYRSIETPAGSSGGAVKEVQGKVFNMILSPFGAEEDLAEAEKITFTIEGSGETNLAQSMTNFFPNLPKRPVKAGDTWTTYDTIRGGKSAENAFKLFVKAENRFEGIEKMNGVDCAKITSTLSGTREQKAQSMGMDVVTGGSFNGKGELFFAVREGYYIKQVDSTRMDGTIKISGDQEMSFPVVMTIVSSNAIRK